MGHQAFIDGMWDGGGGWQLFAGSQTVSSLKDGALTSNLAHITAHTIAIIASITLAKRSEGGRRFHSYIVGGGQGKVTRKKNERRN